MRVNEKIINRLSYILKIIIKKPHLILSLLYKKHLGVIFLIPVNKRTLDLRTNSIINVNLSSNVDDIYRFYKNMKRDSITKERIDNWLSKNYECFLIYEENKVVGGMWIFKNQFELKNLSGRTLSTEKSISLNENTLYGAYVIIDEAYRGKGLNQILLNNVIEYYSRKDEYSNLLVITGASNGAYINSAIKCNAKLIGITEVTNVLGLISRKVLYLDQKLKVWE